MKICIELISSQNHWNTIKLLQFHKDTNSDNEKLTKVKDHECPGCGSHGQYHETANQG